MEVEPEQWLDSITEEQYRTWEAYSRLEPWWGQRELMARLLATMRCLLASKYESDKVAGVLKQVDKVACQYLPDDWIGQPEASPEARSEDSIAAAQKTLEARFG